MSERTVINVSAALDQTKKVKLSTPFSCKTLHYLTKMKEILGRLSSLNPIKLRLAYFA
jgi:hypothetical protein